MFLPSTGHSAQYIKQDDNHPFRVISDACAEYIRPKGDNEDIEEERLLNLDGGDGKSVLGSLSGNSDLSLTQRMSGMRILHTWNCLLKK